MTWTLVVGPMQFKTFVMQHRVRMNVIDFVRHLEQTFQVAYGRNGMLQQTQDALLYSQLQKGLSHCLMEAPTVSRAVDYQSLCLAAKNEECRQAALGNGHLYCRTTLPVPQA